MAVVGGNEYSGHLAQSATIRLTRERAALEKDHLRAEGIFHHFDEQLHKATALIIGQPSTPYAGGFYLFEFIFPNVYPMKPPKVYFRTGDGRVRFNPNLYVKGKVCLSILGTWAGPEKWLPSCTFRSTLLSIQSLLHGSPWQNEPGRDRDNGPNCKAYSGIIAYENVAVAVLHTLSWPLAEHFVPLRHLMVDAFLQRFEEYIEFLASIGGRDNTWACCPLYGFRTHFRPFHVQAELRELRRVLLRQRGLLEAADADEERLEHAEPSAASAASAAAAAAPSYEAWADCPDEEEDEEAKRAGAVASAAETRPEVALAPEGAVASHASGEAATGRTSPELQDRLLAPSPPLVAGRGAGQQEGSRCCLLRLFRRSPAGRGSM